MARMKRSAAAAPDPAPPEAQDIGAAAREHRIAEAAYYRYLKRGAQPGHDLDDWLQAERELRVEAAVDDVV